MSRKKCTLYSRVREGCPECGKPFVVREWFSPKGCSAFRFERRGGVVLDVEVIRGRIVARLPWICPHCGAAAQIVYMSRGFRRFKMARL